VEIKKILGGILWVAYTLILLTGLSALAWAQEISSSVEQENESNVTSSASIGLAAYPRISAYIGGDYQNGLNFIVSRDFILSASFTTSSDATKYSDKTYRLDTVLALKGYDPEQFIGKS
jgi:hypothetical protein